MFTALALDFHGPAKGKVILPLFLTFEGKEQNKTNQSTKHNKNNNRNTK